MKWRRLSLVVVVCPLLLRAMPAASQDAPSAATVAQQKKTLQDAATAGAPLPTTVNVDSSVNVEAVMLPSAVVKRVFGREIAQHYAVIEVNLSNRSNDAGFILQSLFIDYSHWALAQPLQLSGISRPGKPYQAKASTQQVSSVEYRIVRGEMLDYQPWTPRNLGLRSIKVLGSMGTSFAFPFSRDVIKGIDAWNGGVVPGFEALFPDGTEQQLNRISDYGFRNDKVIPQQSSDIVIAFFPVERFLSPTLKHVFLDTPSLFFNPLLMAIDPKSKKRLRPILNQVLGNDKLVDTKLKELLKLMGTMDVQGIADERDNLLADEEALAADTAALNKLIQHHDPYDKTQDKEQAAGRAKATEAVQRDGENVARSREKLNSDTKELRSNGLYNVLSQVSLSNINIVVSGIMTLDEQLVPPSIESTCFDRAGPELWANANTKKCFIRGRFLSNGTPKIIAVDPAELGISNIVVDKDSSSSELLNFSFVLAKPLNSGATLDTVVTKDGKDGKSIDSMKYRVSSAYVLPSPSITTVATDGSGLVTIKGSGFYSNPANLFTLALRQPSGTKDGKADLTVLNDGPSAGDMIALQPANVVAAKVAPGCYAVVVKVGTRRADSPAGQIARVDPTIISVKRQGTTITLGADLSTIGNCSDTLTFSFTDRDGQPVGTPKKLSEGTLADDGKSVAFDLGADATKVSKAGLSGRDTTQVQ